METEEVFVTPVGHKLYFSGGDGESGHRSVGVAIHKRLLQKIDSISFSTLSNRVCQLQFSWGTTYFRCIALYFPTTWHSEDDVEHVKDGCIPILGFAGKVSLYFSQEQRLRSSQFTGRVGTVIEGC